MGHTHVILDGIQDPRTGQALSAAWAQAGFDNVVDVAGQAARLARMKPHDHPSKIAGNAPPRAMTEQDMDQAAAIARSWGLEIRDRVGKTFHAANDLPALRRQLIYEYKCRTATALVFGLPAVTLHYLGPILAGGGTDAASMVFPWAIEMLLVGWACVAAGWPILWQGLLALVRLRPHGDLLTTGIVAVAWLGSAAGVLATALGRTPWFMNATESGVWQGGPAFHAAWWAVTLAVCQRWLAHRHAHRLAGRAQLMIHGFGRVAGLWLIGSVGVMLTAGWWLGLAVGLLLPSMASLGAINRHSPGWSAVLPVFGLTGVMLIGPRAMRVPITGVEIEIAVGFAWLMTAVLAWGWRAWPSPADTCPPPDSPQVTPSDSSPDSPAPARAEKSTG